MTDISEEKLEKLEKSADRNTCCGCAASFLLLFLPFPIFLITFSGVYAQSLLSFVVSIE
jgi:hypothetical protein